MFEFFLPSNCVKWFSLRHIFDIDDDDDNDKEFISAYPFYMKLALRPKIIYTKKKYCTMRYREIIS